MRFVFLVTAFVGALALLLGLGSSFLSIAAELEPAVPESFDDGWVAVDYFAFAMAQHQLGSLAVGAIAGVVVEGTGVLLVQALFTRR